MTDNTLGPDPQPTPSSGEQGAPEGAIPTSSKESDDTRSVGKGKSGTSDPGVEKTRAITGLLAVIIGDVVIAAAAIAGIIYAARQSGSSSNAAQIVAILSGGFTAIGTMTTAYFGIKSISNTANNLAGPPTGNAGNPDG